MNVELLRQFGERLLAPHGGQSHLRFESRRVVPAWSSAHRLSCSAAILAAVRQKRHLSNPFKNPEPALSSHLWHAKHGHRHHRLLCHVAINGSCENRLLAALTHAAHLAKRFFGSPSPGGPPRT